MIYEVCVQGDSEHVHLLPRAVVIVLVTKGVAFIWTRGRVFWGRPRLSPAWICQPTIPFTSDRSGFVTHNQLWCTDDGVSTLATVMKLCHPAPTLLLSMLVCMDQNIKIIKITCEILSWKKENGSVFPIFQSFLFCFSFSNRFLDVDDTGVRVI